MYVWFCVTERQYIRFCLFCDQIHGDIHYDVFKIWVYFKVMLRFDLIQEGGVQTDSLYCLLKPKARTMNS